MAQVNITGLTLQMAEEKARILQHIQDHLSAEEIERLGMIARSPKARTYLKSKFFVLKGFLKL